MIRIIYKTTHENGRYYIGKHETIDIDDGYLGSGKWVKSIKNKSSLSREIMTEASSSEELSLLEEYYIAASFDDPLCMNMRLGSTGRTSEDGVRLSKRGKNHYRHNPRIHHLVNDEGHEFKGTQNEFFVAHRLDRGRTSLLVTGKAKCHHGWRIFGAATTRKKRVDNTGRKIKSTVYEFIHSDGKTFIGTQNAFMNEYKLHSGALSQMINGNPRVKSVKGWKVSMITIVN